MTMVRRIQTHAISLAEVENRRIQHHLDRLERRLQRYPEPIATLVVTAQQSGRRITADLRVQLGHLGEHLISHEHSDTADSAVRLATEDIERQVERLQATHAG